MANKNFNFQDKITQLLFSNKKFAIILGVLLIVVSFGGVFLINRPSKSIVEEGDIEYTQNFKDDSLVEFGFSKTEVESMDEERKIDLANKVIIPIRNQVAGDEWKDEYPQELLNETKNKYYKLASYGDYQSIIEDFDNLKLKYYFSSPQNKKLIQIYNDAYALNSASNDSNNFVQQQDTLSKLGDEKMLLSALLQSNLENRNSALVDKMSLTFASESKTFRINSVTSASMYDMAKNKIQEKDPYINKIFDYLMEGDFIIYKINFNLGVDIFNAYMFKSVDDAKLKTFGIYAENPSNLKNTYNTVVESEEVLSSMEAGGNGVVNEENLTNEEEYNNMIAEMNENNTIDYNPELGL